MAEDHALDLYASTRQSVESVISKPKCTDKLLSKPPFRFLHDVIIGIKNATGFGEAIFTESETNSENVQGKEDKLEFLQKIIDLVSQTLDETINCKPAKVLAGAEPENTNILLQSLVKAATLPKKTKSVKKREENVGKEEMPKKKATKKKTKEDSTIPSETETVLKKKVKKKVAQPEEVAAPPIEDPTPKKTRKKAKEEEVPPPTEESSQPKKVVKKKTKTEPNQETNVTEPERRKKKTKKIETPDVDLDGEKTARKRNSDEPPRSARGTSGDLMSAVLPSAATSINSGSNVRPSSARLAPPRIVSNVRTVDKPQIDAPSAERKVAVIEEGLDEDLDENMMSQLDEDEKSDNENISGSESPEGNPENYGGLVRDIIAASKSSEDDIVKKKKEKVDVVTSAHQKEALQKEISKHREMIQLICRGANPLGKTMDYVQEDFENMTKELERWRRESSEQYWKLEDEQRMTEKAIIPLQQTLVELDRSIRDMQQRISAAKASTSKNDEGIMKMLSMVVNH